MQDALLQTLVELEQGLIQTYYHRKKIFTSQSLSSLDHASEGIKYLKQEYTQYEYPILGDFRVQVPENLWKTGMSSFSGLRIFK